MVEGRRPLEYLLIRDMPISERPRERLRDNGAAFLSNSELLAILLRTGSASESSLSLATRLLSSFHGLGGVSRASFAELHEFKGMGEAKTAQIQAALELGKRLTSLAPEERPVVRSPRDVANLLMGEMGLLEQEHLRVVLLNTKNHVLGVNQVYVGNVSSSLLRTSRC